MKAKISLLLLLLMFSFSFCQQDDNMFSSLGKAPEYHSLEGNLNSYGNSVISSGKNNLLICGNRSELLSILKTTNKGVLVWRNDFSTGNGSSTSSIVQTHNREIFVCGSTIRNYQDSRADILLVKANSKGDTLWTKTYGGDSFDYAINMIVTSDGNLLIAAKTESFNAGSFGDIYLLKLNFNGDTLWTRTYPDPGEQFPTHLMETANGEFLVTGNNHERGMDTQNEMYFLKTDSKGNKTWDKKIGSKDWKWAFSSIEMEDGSLLCCGSNTADGFGQILVVKTDPLGNLLWEKKYEKPGHTLIAYSMLKNPDETYSITGSSFDYTTGLFEIILYRITETGIPQWSKQFGSSKKSVGLNLLNDTQNNTVIIGNYNENMFFSIVDDKGNFQ